MTTEDKAVLVTGANRGIGQALVEEALTARRKPGVRRGPASRSPTPMSGSRPFSWT